MSLFSIPLQAVPAQQVNTSLGSQQCTITIKQYQQGLFVDLYLNDALIVGGVLALNLVKLVRDKYHGIIGDLYFYDTQGDADPVYTGLGSRYHLYYDDAL